MTRKKFGNKNKRGDGNQKKRSREDPGQGKPGNYDDAPSENPLYEGFYRKSGLISEEEWDAFWGAIKTTLPTTFRFAGSKGHALSTLKTLQDVHIPHLEGIIWEDKPVSPPKPIPWYPDNLAWSMTVGKTTIRRCPPFKKFQNFLVAETTVGNISRQEAVSMIPPLLMDVEPHHKVLDMCAAPGSKTAQLIEMIHTGEETAIEAAVDAASALNITDDGEIGGRPSGLVIANDADYKRSHMLIHQTKRLNSANLIVSNHDATMFPSLLTSAPDAPRKEYLKFDRILCDVPCSGDGTARKNYSVWRDWNPNSAFNLHMTQVRILIRGLQMLKVGGRLVYSTCSMNPVENEAVLAAAIDRCGGLDKVNIVDVSERLPQLKRRPGLKGGWKIMDKDETWYSSWDEVYGEPAGRDARISRIVKTMFPSEDGKTDDDPTRIPLERSLRVYPHLQDTGGFFIAVLEKKEEIGAVKPEEGSRRKMAAIARAQQGVEPTKDANHSDVPADAETPLTNIIDQTEVVESSIARIDDNVPQSPDDSPADPSPPPSPGKRKLDSPVPTQAVKKLKAEDSLKLLSSAPSPVASSPTPQKKGKGPPPEEPFKYLQPDHPVLKQIYEYYGLSPRFPRTCYMVRNAECIPSRAIYFTSHLAKRILEANEGKGVKFVHCGVKAFMKQDVQSPEVCPWRIQSEGLGLIAPWVGPKRVVTAKKRETVHALLQELFPMVGNEDSKSADANPAEGSDRKKTIEEIDSQVRTLGMGCCILKVQPGDAEDEFQEKMTLPLWKSRFSCNLMLPKDERKAMLLRLFDDTTEVRDSTNKNRVQDRKLHEETGGNVATVAVDQAAAETAAPNEKDVYMEDA